MLRLKKKTAEAAPEEAEAASSNPEASSAPSGAPVEAGVATAGGDGGQKLKLFGVGGKSTGGAEGGAKTVKKTPGEIRIQKDIADLDGGSVASVSFPNPNDLTRFNVVVAPDSGMWVGARYNFSFVVPALYPHEPPKVTCLDKIYHPNINLQGNVCLNILREDWKPVLDINAVIYGLIYLFYEPNPDDPLNREAADLYRNNKRDVSVGTVNSHFYMHSISLSRRLITICVFLSNI
jgi:ubiquitin-conjugating enzyme E2 M